jgi:putative membrane protein
MKSIKILAPLITMAFSLTAGAQAPGSARPPGQQQPSIPGQAETPAQPAAGKPAKTEASAPVSEEDFVRTAAMSGHYEVMSAKLAVTKANDKKVKSFAEMLIKDHSAANKNLQAVADGLKITLAKEDPEKQAQYDALGAKIGAEFDAAFLDEMTLGHDKSIALYESARETAKSKSVLAYINKTLPVIKAHADKLAKMKSSAPAAATKPSGTDASRAPAPR